MTALVLLLACAEPPSDRRPPPATTTTAPAEDPGRVAVRRLNRREYANTVAALFDTTRDITATFPDDDAAFGFDTAPEALPVAPVHAEAWERAAREVVAELVGEVTDTVVRVEGEGPGPTWSTGAPFEDRAWRLDAPGVLAVDQALPAGGLWRVDVTAWAEAPTALSVLADGVLAGVLDVRTGEPAPTYTVEIALDAGHHTVELVVDDGAVYVDAIGFAQVAPLRAPAWDRLVPCADDADRACAEAVLAELLPRAWRRPVPDDERAPLLGLYDAGRDAGLPFPESLGLALQAMLLSPDFLFRLELDPAPDAAAARPVTEHELAARLSYLLWSGPPDDALRAHADAGTLRTNLADEIGRMIADDRATALVDGFAAPWLELDRLPWAVPDADAHPEWDEDLRASLDAELRLFAGEILLRERSLLDLLTSHQTWIDDRLAAHYGLPAPGAGGFVPIAGDRTGVLGKGALHAALAHPDRTAPVQRGAWALSALLCAPPPPPPPDVPVFDPGPFADGSVRDLLERHRADPACAACHDRIDPLGFALEHYGPTGAHRTVDAHGEPVDARGELPDGRVVDSVDSLAALLAADPDVPACMVQQLWTYALGRAPRAEDLPALDRITAAFVDGGHRLEPLIVAIATDPSFQERVPWAD